MPPPHWRPRTFFRRFLHPSLFLQIHNDTLPPSPVGRGLWGEGELQAAGPAILHVAQAPWADIDQLPSGLRLGRPIGIDQANHTHPNSSTTSPQFPSPQSDPHSSPPPSQSAPSAPIAAPGST